MDERRSRFEAQVLPHLDAAYRFARWLSRAPGDADDLVQDAILRAFRGFDGLRSADVKAWLLAIVRNCHLTALGQAERRAHVPLPDEDDTHDGLALAATTCGPESEIVRHEDERTLSRLIAALPPDHREVLLLREIEGLDYREIAAITRVPIGTVMSRLARARSALKVRALAAAGGPRAVR